MSKLVGVMCVIAALGSLAGCGGDDDGGDDSAAGSGGALPGTGGMTAGSGGSGTAGAPAGTGECATADVSAGGPALHAAAAEVLAAMSPCGFGGCHVGTVPAGMLTLLGATDLRTALVGKMSCEAPSVPLIDGSGNEAALKNSWVWLKLTAPADDTAGITEQPTFGAPGVCGQLPGQKYGLRMPMGTPAAMTASDTRLAKIRNWICAGAPGPQ